MKFDRSIEKLNETLAKPSPYSKYMPAFRRLLVIGISLAMCAGYINAYFLIGPFSTGVSHLTGHTTRSAISFAKAEEEPERIYINRAYETGGTSLGIIACFCLGSITCSLIIGDLRDGGFKPTRNYGTAILVESLVLIIPAIVGSEYPILSLFTAAFACGLQNAIMTTYSSAIIRTTHVTGLVTDIGILIGGYIRNVLIGRDKKRRKKGLWKLYVLIPLLVAFYVGCFIGGVFYVYVSPTSKILFLPAAVLFLMGSIFYALRVVLERKLMSKGIELSRTPTTFNTLFRPKKKQVDSEIQQKPTESQLDLKTEETNNNEKLTSQKEQDNVN